MLEAIYFPGNDNGREIPHAGERMTNPISPMMPPSYSNGFDWGEMERLRLRSEIEIAKASELMKVREDIKIRKGLLQDQLLINPDGTLERNVEFFRESKKKYEAANFRILSAQICRPNEGQGEILYFVAETSAGKNVELFCDLMQENSNYIRKKFRNQGLKLNLKRHENSECYWDLVSEIAERSLTVIIPTRHGFYRGENGELQYAGRDDRLWEEVQKRAE